MVCQSTIVELAQHLEGMRLHRGQHLVGGPVQRYSITSTSSGRTDCRWASVSSGTCGLGFRDQWSYQLLPDPAMTRPYDQTGYDRVTEQKRCVLFAS